MWLPVLSSWKIQAFPAAAQAEKKNRDDHLH